MKKNILSTFITKLFSGIMNLLLIILTTQFLGAEGKGEIGIFILNLTVILMLSDVVGGAGLVYVIPRSDIFKVAVSSYTWAMFSSLFFTLIFYLFRFSEINFLPHLFFLSLLLNFTTVNSNILVGKEKINQSNFLAALQIFVLVFTFAILVYVLDKKEIYSYFISLYASYGITLMAGIILIKKQIISTSLKGIINEIKKMFGYGILVQAGNFIQLMNYRFGYYLLEHFHGAGAVGIYSTGTSLCEAVWIISNSISSVQYARISNTTDITYAQLLSVRLSKISLFVTIIAMLPLIFLPGKFYEFIFGPGFDNIKTVILTLFLGVSSFGLTAMYSHYFSGTGKVRINTISSLVGLFFTLVAGFILIPGFGLKGAGITASVSFLATSGFLVIYFLKETGISILELIPSFADIRFFISETKGFLKKP